VAAAGARTEEVAEGVYCVRTGRGLTEANVYLVRSGPSWVLIDAAWPHRGQLIKSAAESLLADVGRQVTATDLHRVLVRTRVPYLLPGLNVAQVTPVITHQRCQIARRQPRSDPLRSSSPKSMPICRIGVIGFLFPIARECAAPS